MGSRRVNDPGSAASEPSVAALEGAELHWKIALIPPALVMREIPKRI